MNPQDILFARLGDRTSVNDHTRDHEQCVAFLITDKARAFAARVFGLGKIERVADNTVDAIFLREITGEAFLADCYEAEDLRIHDCSDYMGYFPALLNARQLTDRERVNETENAVLEYYGPKFDALNHEYHRGLDVSDDRKKEIRDEVAALVREMPPTTGRITINNRYTVKEPTA
jgi:hypothetical protein